MSVDLNGLSEASLMSFAKAELKRRLPGAVYTVSIGLSMGSPITVKIHRSRTGLLGWFGLKEQIGEATHQHVYALALLAAIDDACGWRRF